MISRVIKKTVELNQIQKVDQLEGPLYQLEQDGHIFEIACLMNGEAAGVSGTVFGRFLRADGSTVLCDGSLVGNVASVTLPQPCYNVPGRFGLVIFINGNDVTTAVYAVAGSVYRSTSDTYVDPAGEIPSLEEVIAAAENAEAWAVGTKNGTPVGSSAPQYENNAKYWSDHAFSATPSGYEELVSDVAGLDTDVSNLNSAMSAIDTATADDEGKALKAKTVSGGKVTEWEFGDSGQMFYTTGTLNLLDGVNWTAGSLGSSDPVPVEYGKKYTASFAAYANRVFALDASMNELGDTSTDTYIKRTEVFSVWCKKYVYEVINQSVKYIRFKQMSQPTAPYFLVEGDIDMPYPLDVSTLTAHDPDLDNLRKVIFGDEKVGFGDLIADISNGVKKLGYTDKAIESGDVQGYDAETYPLTFDGNGKVVMTNASALRSGTYVMLLKANVNGLYIDKFGYNIDSGAPSGGLAGPPAIVMQSNVGHTGYLLNFRTY